MTQTQRLLQARFLHDVAELIYDYFRPRKMTDRGIAKAGCYELCAFITEYDEGFDGACYGDYDAIMRLMLYRGFKLSGDDCIMYSIARNNNRTLFDRVHADWSKGDYRSAICGAYRGGHTDFADELKKSMAAAAINDSDSDEDDAWERWSYRAGIGCNWDMISALPIFDWPSGLVGACKRGDLEIATKMIAAGGRVSDDSLMYACRSGSIALVDLMIRNGSAAWYYGLVGACQGGHEAIATLMIERCEVLNETHMEAACQYGHVNIIQLLREHAVSPTDGCIELAISRGHIDVVREIAPDFSPDRLTEMLSYAIDQNQYDVAHTLIGIIKAMKADKLPPYEEVAKIAI